MLHKLPFGALRSSPLNEVSRWVRFAFPPSCSSSLSETLRFSQSPSERERDITDFLRGHGSEGNSSAPPPRGDGQVTARHGCNEFAGS